MSLNHVERLLKEKQIFRDSDRWLLLGVWRAEGLELSDDQMRKFMKCSSAESITRRRRLLKEKYPATKAIDEERYNKFIDHKNNRAYMPAEED
jgi:uncharacterized protein YllA (UPF0747 family)